MWELPQISANVHNFCCKTVCEACEACESWLNCNHGICSLDSAGLQKISPFISKLYVSRWVPTYYKIFLKSQPPIAMLNNVWLEAPFWSCMLFSELREILNCSMNSTNRKTAQWQFTGTSTEEKCNKSVKVANEELMASAISVAMAPSLISIMVTMMACFRLSHFYYQGSVNGQRLPFLCFIWHSCSPTESDRGCCKSQKIKLRC